MKKARNISALLLAVVLTLALGISAMAAPVAPSGITVKQVYDFTSLPNGDTTDSALGFWNPTGGSANVNVNNGVITFASNNWGAFPNFTDKQMNILKESDGWGFYFKAGNEDAAVTMGFNGANGVNHVLATGKPVILCPLSGEPQNVNTEYSDGLNQGIIIVPAGFEGYIYIPFNAYITNDGNNAAFDVTVNPPATPIYVLGLGAPAGFGEIVAYSEGPQGTADLSVVAYAAAAVTGLGSLLFIRKRK